MAEVFEKLISCEQQIRRKTDFVPRVGLVLGSGLGDFADGMQIEAIVNYSDIEGFPVSTAPGHAGRFVFGYVGEVPVVCMQGRIHFYEGYDPTDVVLPIRIMARLGAKNLILTNASGAISNRLKAGDLMLIRDHIALFVPSPLRGKNIDELGVRFPDMSHIYDEELQALVKRKAVELEIPIKEGVYVQSQGPQYESPAEINAFRMLGADVVGMSTAIEAIAANHMGMRIVGISCASNLAAGISPNPLTEEEVLEAGQKVSKTFSKLITGIIEEM